MPSRRNSLMLDLAGGSGENPKRPGARPAFVFDPTPEQIAAMSDDRLLDVFAALAEYDASGGRVKRKLRRELDRRGPGGRLEWRSGSI